jgi:hypothetical protein
MLVVIAILLALILFVLAPEFVLGAVFLIVAIPLVILVGSVVLPPMLDGSASLYAMIVDTFGGWNVVIFIAVCCVWRVYAVHRNKRFALDITFSYGSIQYGNKYVNETVYSTFLYHDTERRTRALEELCVELNQLPRWKAKSKLAKFAKHQRRELDKINARTKTQAEAGEFLEHQTRELEAFLVTHWR